MRPPTEPITDYLRRRLREEGTARFEVIADEAGVAVSFIRKFHCGSRENPRVQTIQPLLDYFERLDAASVGDAQQSPLCRQPNERQPASPHARADHPARQLSPATPVHPAHDINSGSRLGACFAST